MDAVKKLHCRATRKPTSSFSVTVLAMIAEAIKIHKLKILSYRRGLPPTIHWSHEKPPRDP